ncbi:MAG TPA: IclR family transcriptional regulator [Bacillota bacterium]|nr:IclR family transcriptional regulator [Bacillota bacterium]
MQNKNKTVVKSMDLLNLFLTHTKLSLSEMVELSGMPKTSVHRMVGSLEDMGFLTKDKDGKYSLGLLFLQFGQLVAERLDIRQLALPIMQILRDDVEEAVNLIVKDGKESMYIEKLDTNHPVRLYTKIGRRAPLYAGACSRILLTYLPDHEREEYLQGIELNSIGLGTITDKEELRSLLDNSRKYGYSVSHSELEDHTSAVAAPIFDYTGQMVAGLSIAGPDVRFKDERLPELIKKVKEAANEISKKLGWMDSSLVVR